jgi:hypothetical protein
MLAVALWHWEQEAPFALKAIPRSPGKPEVCAAEIPPGE